MENQISRLENIRNTVYTYKDFPTMAICHVVEEVAKVMWQKGYKWEQDALNAAGSLIYNFPVGDTENGEYPEAIRYGFVILIDRVIDNLTERM